jgi:hypothetical protein
VDSWAIALGVIASARRVSRAARSSFTAENAEAPKCGYGESTGQTPLPVDPEPAPASGAVAHAETRRWLILGAIVLLLILAMYYSNRVRNGAGKEPVPEDDLPPKVHSDDEGSGVPPAPPLGPWRPSNR